jgi:ribosomal biogenesis protein LAS1
LPSFPIKHNTPFHPHQTVPTSNILHQSHPQHPNHNTNPTSQENHPPNPTPRFITGLADTQIDLTRDRPSWFPSGKSLQLPLALLETRHRIVHRHLPSLAELKRAATESLSWLWDWYWAQLDHAFSTSRPSTTTPEAGPEEELGLQTREAIVEKLQNILKLYVKERKADIKNRKNHDNRAAETALSTYTLRFAPSATTTPSHQTRRLLLQLLVQERMMLPTDKKLGSSMSGAFLIWTPLLRTFCHAGVLDVGILVECLMHAMNASSPAARAMVNPEMDPIREGLQDWIVHVLTGEEWAGVRGAAERQLVENVLATCFSHPTFWNLRVAERVLGSGRVEDVRSWRAVLEAARAEGGGEEKMDVDVDVEGIERALPVRENEGKDGAVKEKIKGPTKVLGMWKPRSVGWLPEGWEDDE